MFGGGFGSTNLFGTPTTTATSLGSTQTVPTFGFGAAPTNTFAQPAQTNTFGSSMTFGSAAPATATFGAPAASTSFSFGSTAAAAPTTTSFGGFGSTQGSSMFGATNQVKAGSGIAPYRITEEKTSDGSTLKFAAITRMEEFKGKVLEEIRWEDMQIAAGKIPASAAAAPATTFGSPTQPNIFGSTQPAAAATTFGTPTTGTSFFGSPTTTVPTFGATGSMFGTTAAPAATPATSQFSFGSTAAPAATTTSAFSFGSTPSTTTTTTAPSSFNFGATTQPAQTTFGFGTQPAANTGTGLFGTTTAGAPSLFSTAQPAAAPTSTFSFGAQSAAPATAAPAFSFGSTNTSTTTPATTTPSFNFGAPAQPATTGLFGAATTTAPATTAPSFSFGTTPAAAPANPTPSFNFGATAAPATTATTTPSFNFGAAATTTTTTTTPSFNFGASPAPAATTTTTPSFNFGAAATTTTTTTTPSFNFGASPAPAATTTTGTATTTTAATTTQTAAPAFNFGAISTTATTTQQPAAPFQMASSVPPPVSSPYGSIPDLKSLFNTQSKSASTGTTLNSPSSLIAHTALLSARPSPRLKLQGTLTPSMKTNSSLTSSPQSTGLLLTPGSRVTADVSRVFSSAFSSRQNVKQLSFKNKEKIADTETTRLEAFRQSPNNSRIVEESVNDSMNLSAVNDSRLFGTPIRPDVQESRIELAESMKKPEAQGKGTATPKKQFPPHLSQEFIEKGYYTIPSIEELSLLPEEQLSKFQNFKIGHKKHGFVEFLEPVDLRNVQLDTVIVFESGSVEIYPEASKLPPKGTGLNVRVRVTLEGILEKKKTKEQFTEFLKSTAASWGAVFINWEPATKKWIFELNPQ
eukprot:TRINITY_DN60_c0_g1_i4.p1 TRINITY_DN60_c0_g1~~TRINITY_DN60_c0_g1_i4.p1  ORF type:complete len:861 (+),score=340.74 TRINITY_DN60_c0_g1_i4:3-2585(+)